MDIFRILKGLTEFAKFFKIPCVGGKVSLYNETSSGSIKPSPIIGVLGLIDKKPLIPQKITEGDTLIVIGNTKDEMGGSEYFEYIHKFIGGNCPTVDLRESKKNMTTVLKAIKSNLIKSAHDCSKGGLAVATSEMCMKNQIGCNVKLEMIPGEKLNTDRILFSESHSRYLLVSNKENISKLETLLNKNKVSFAIIGQFVGKAFISQKETNP